MAAISSAMNASTGSSAGSDPAADRLHGLLVRLEESLSREIDRDRETVRRYFEDGVFDVKLRATCPSATSAAVTSA
jgi:hypothetical protein